MICFLSRISPIILWKSCPASLKIITAIWIIIWRKKQGWRCQKAGQKAQGRGRLRIIKSKPRPEDIKNQQLKQAHERHNEALKRLEEIKKESRALEAESKQLETESYVKSRFLSDAFGRDPNMIKEYGIRLKGDPKTDT